MRRLIIALALISSLCALTLPTSSQGLLVVQRKAVTAAPTPPLPAFDNVVAAYGLWNFNPAGYSGGIGIQNAEQGNLTFSEGAPFPLNWAGAGEMAPPILVDDWADQNSNTNDLIQSGAARPVLDATNKWIAFDGVQTGLQGGVALFPDDPVTQTGTIYVLFKAGSLVETSVIFETGNGNVGAANRISIRMVAGVFTASAFDATPLSCLPNSKIKTISDANWHLAAFTFDSTNGTPANQTALKIDNSTSGVSSPASADLASGSMGNGAPSVGARNNAASNFFTGSMRAIYCKNVVDDATAQTATYNYWTYLQSTMP